MENEIEMNADMGLSRARQEAEKLAKKLDHDNEINNRRPLMDSREQFVAFMTSQLAKLLVHRTVLRF